MHRLYNALARLDMLLIWRVFAPVAYYADRRWHQNQFRLAGWCVLGSMGLLALRTAGDVMRGSWIALMMIAITALNFWLYSKWLKEFESASRWQEANPGRLALPYHSWVLLPYSVRLLNFWLGLCMAGVDLAQAIISPTTGNIFDCLTGQWLTLIGCAIYFASVLPPRHTRQAKKERAPAGLAPAGV